MAKILVVEDQEDIRDALVEILTAENFEVIDAEDGKIGLELASSEIPDLVICDVMMPNLDGYQLVSCLRDNPATEAIPFIFLTAKVTQIDRRQGMELGADDYLTKPFTRAELLGAIQVRLQKQKVFNQQVQKKLNLLCRSITYSLPHELHTPLNGIIGMSKLLIDTFDSLERDESIKMLQDIYSSGERLYQLTQKFLLYAQVEVMAASSQIDKKAQNNDSSSPTKLIITDIAVSKARKVGRELDLSLNLQEASVTVGISELKTIVEEVVDNAYKFSQPSTPISITSDIEENIFKITVMDAGRGMTNDQVASLGAYIQFERKLYEQQGSGLGLIIAKRLTELHGGKLTIDSIAGKQTKVSIFLPIAH